jgi:lantibiotic modifying enzyme
LDIKNKKMIETQVDSKLIEQIKYGEQVLSTLPFKGNSLFSGKLGRILYLAYNYKLLGNEDNIETVVQYLDEIFDYFKSASPEAILEIPWVLPSLCRVLTILNKDNIIEIELDEQEFFVFDEMVYKSGKTYLLNSNIDFLYGASGTLNYLVSRINDNQKIHEYITNIFDDLLINKIEDHQGVRFFNSHISKQNRSADIDLGVAHGQCGLILTLLNIYEAGMLQSQIKGLVADMLTYILGLKREPERADGIHSYFPVTIDEAYDKNDPVNLKKYNDRLGWCYGDLNIALTFYRAARVLGLDELVVIADEVGLDTCKRRTEENSGIENAHLCHGSASMVLMYNTLYEERNLPEYHDTKEFWLQYTQDYIETELQVPTSNGRAEQLLMGIPGVMLVLITEALNDKQNWQNIFLM